MSLNPKILPDADGVYWLHWTPDPTAGGYAFTTPTGASRSFNKTLSKTKLGKHAEPVVATVAALDVSARAAEQASYPAVVEPPPPPPPPVATGFQFGLVVRAPVASDIEFAKRLGAKIIRVEFPASSPATRLDAWVNAASAAGIKVQPLAGFQGHAVTTAEAQNLKSWAVRHAEKIGPIEFGNETSYPYQAGSDLVKYDATGRNYALRAKEAAIALQGTGVGLLIQNDEADGWPWVKALKAAVPDLDKYAAGWTVHPYGPGGRNRIATLISQSRAVGWSDSIPIYATEWGFATDDGRTLTNNYGWPTNQTFAAAAAAMKSELAWYRSQPRVKQVMYYMSIDGAAPGSSNEREAYFGLFRTNGAEKGALTVEARAQAAV